MKTETVTLWFAQYENHKSIPYATKADAEDENPTAGSFVSENHTVTYSPASMDYMARDYVMDAYENIPVYGWTNAQYWSYIIDDYIGGRAAFLMAHSV